MRRLFGMAVGLAVNLHNEARGRAVEVGDIGAHRMLPAEPQGRDPFASQRLPQDHLRQAHRPP
jgi:hypothetical protein